MKGFPRRGSDRNLASYGRTEGEASMKGFPRRGSDDDWLTGCLDLSEPQ